MDQRIITATGLLGFTLIACDGSAPTPGEWEYSDYAATSNNTCTGDLVDGGDGSFMLVESSDGYTIEPGDGGGDFACTLDGDELTCTRAMSITVTGNGVIKGNETAVANVTSDTMEGTRKASVTCEGSDCAMASQVGLTFPCELEIDFTAELK